MCKKTRKGLSQRERNGGGAAGGNALSTGVPARSLDRSIDHFLPTAVSPGLTKVFMVDSAM